jgi:hypothetical protein
MQVFGSSQNAHVTAVGLPPLRPPSPPGLHHPTSPYALQPLHRPRSSALSVLPGL